MRLNDKIYCLTAELKEKEQKVNKTTIKERRETKAQAKKK